MLTNPSPNARTPRAVSRRRTLRRSRSELLIRGGADVDVSQKLRGTLGALNQVSPEVFEAIDLGCAALWSSYHQSVLAAGWPVTSGASAASACYEVTVARTRLDRNSLGLICRQVCSSRTQVAVGTRDVWPVDRRHEGIDIGGGSCSVIHVIRVLVHVECKNWLAAGKCRRMVHRPLIDELAITG